MHDVIVTLDGDIVEQGGVVAGGSRESSGSGILAQKRGLLHLDKIVVQLQSDLTEATARLVNADELKQVQKRSKACAPAPMKAIWPSWVLKKMRCGCAVS